MNSELANEATHRDEFSACINSESEDSDEFVDAINKTFEESDSDVYGDDVQFVSGENDDYVDEETIGIDAKFHELGLMLNSTLASDYDGANAARLNAHFFNDWAVLLEKQAIELGFPDLEELLKSEYMKDFVEQKSSVNGVAVYRAVSKLANEHILRRVADCKLSENQKAEKRRIQRLMELKNPENAGTFLEGKRRILQILFDLKAYEKEVDYQTIRDEYMKRYNVSLNASEHQRLFMNRSALKNFWRAFYREVILTNSCPIHVKLRSSDVKIPEEITEDLHLLAEIDKIELPTFALEHQLSISENIAKGILSYCIQKPSMKSKPTMDWGEEVEGSEEKKLNDVSHTFDIEHVNSPVNAMHVNVRKTRDISTGGSGIMSPRENGINEKEKPFDLDEDKYTGDEESSDSTDPEAKVFGKRRKKRLKGNINTFNISSTSPKSQSLLQTPYVNGVENHRIHSEEETNFGGQSTRLMEGGGNKHSVKRLPIAERSLHQSVNRSNPAEFNELQSLSASPSSMTSSKVIQELRKLPYGSYSVPNSAAGQSTSYEGQILHFQLSEGTQTDENWLENLLRELECSNVKWGNLFRFKIHITRTWLLWAFIALSALPQIVGSFYGALVDPEKDQNYRKTWRAIVTNHCSPEILIAPLPNGENNTKFYP
uniref:Uncharacterized protein n=1 Tax=Setaria digitata TaxID=48799 RepID=A0A915PGV8_9BILA